MIFHTEHCHSVADSLCLKVWYGPSTSCTVSMATRADLLRSGLTWNRRLWTRSLTSKGNYSKPASRPKDNILNIYYNFSHTCRLLVPTFFDIKAVFLKL